MPKVLELTEIGGHIYARLDVDMKKTPQPISLFDATELAHAKRAAIICDLDELADNFEGAGPDAPWTGQEIADHIRDRIKNYPAVSI